MVPFHNFGLRFLRFLFLQKSQVVVGSYVFTLDQCMVYSHELCVCALTEDVCR